jgi:Cysteine rich repeat
MLARGRSFIVACAMLMSPVALGLENDPPEVRSACRADFTELCRSVRPGEGRMVRCLRNRSDHISEACRTALRRANVKLANPPQVPTTPESALTGAFPKSQQPAGKGR